MAASKIWIFFRIDLKTAFLQGQSYDVNRDVVCQLPLEASHPPYIAARLTTPAYGMNDAPRRWCVSKLGNPEDKTPSHSGAAQATS